MKTITIGALFILSVASICFADQSVKTNGQKDDSFVKNYKPLNENSYYGGSNNQKQQTEGNSYSGNSGKKNNSYTDRTQENNKGKEANAEEKGITPFDKEKPAKWY